MSQRTQKALFVACGAFLGFVGCYSILWVVVQSGMGALILLLAALSAVAAGTVEYLT